MPDMKCNDCGRTIGELEVFPGKRCLNCHAAIVDRIPLDRLPRPDFVGALNLARKPRRRRRVALEG